MRLKFLTVIVASLMAYAGPHALDDGQAKRRRILLVALAAGADRMRVFAGLEEHFGDGAFVNTIMLKYEKPAANPAVLVDLRPHAGRGGFGRAQRAGICNETGHDDRQKLKHHNAATASEKWK